MDSVASIVKSKQKERKERADTYEQQKMREKKKQDSKQFSGEVAYLIKQFEYNIFNLNSTNKQVADFLLDYKGKYYITKADDLTQQMPGYIYVKPFMYALKFYKTEKMGKQSITKSSKFNKWKKALEDKFKVKIYIERDYIYKERYGNSGYRTYDDEIFQGVLLTVQLQKKD